MDVIPLGIALPAAHFFGSTFHHGWASPCLTGTLRPAYYPID